MTVTEEQVEGYIKFPCCPSEKKIVYGGCRGIVSDKCPNCHKFAKFDLDAMTSWRVSAARGAVSKLNNRICRSSR